MLENVGSVLKHGYFENVWFVVNECWHTDKEKRLNFTQTSNRLMETLTIIKGTV